MAVTMQNKLAIFLSGRAILLVVLLSFQVLIIRLLPADQYGRFAIVFAWAALMQTVVSFGIPKLIPRYLGQAGWGIANRAAARLVWAIIVFRLLATAALLALGWWAARAMGFAGAESTAYLAAGAFYILVSLIQVDGDAMVQALDLQHNSRTVSVTEAVARLGIVYLVAAVMEYRTAAAVLAVGTATAGVAAIANIAAVLRAIARHPASTTARPLDRAELRGIALSGYASAMAWFATSPSMIRLLATRALDMVAFAGFSFVQTLVLSFQRYTPGQLLFPFVEPAAMRHFLRTGDRERLAAALSLIVKLDLIAIGAAVVGTIVAGAPIIAILTHDRYTGMAIALPWLLLYVLATSIHRAFEIVAVSIGATRALVRTLPISLAWLAIAVAAAGRFGLIALLLVPIGDSLTRLSVTEIALRRHGIRHVVDLGIATVIVASAAIASLAGRALVSLSMAGPFAAVAIGAGVTLVFLAALALAKPLRPAELSILAQDRQGKAIDRLRWLTRA